MAKFGPAGKRFLEAVIQCWVRYQWDMADADGAWKPHAREGVQTRWRRQSSWFVAPASPTPQSSTRREFLNVLKSELPLALAHLQRENIAPVDLAQAAIGPRNGSVYALLKSI